MKKTVFFILMTMTQITFGGQASPYSSCALSLGEIVHGKSFLYSLASDVDYVDNKFVVSVARSTTTGKVGQKILALNLTDTDGSNYTISIPKQRAVFDGIPKGLPNHESCGKFFFKGKEYYTSLYTVAVNPPASDFDVLIVDSEKDLAGCDEDKNYKNVAIQKLNTENKQISNVIKNEVNSITDDIAGVYDQFSLENDLIEKHGHMDGSAKSMRSKLVAELPRYLDSLEACKKLLPDDKNMQNLINDELHQIKSDNNKYFGKKPADLTNPLLSSLWTALDSMNHRIDSDLNTKDVSASSASSVPGTK